MDEKEKNDHIEILDKPKADSKDAVHTLVKAVLSTVPIAGGPAAELFSAIITPPLVKRRDQWIESIAEGLKILQERFDNFNIEDLSQNDMFITTVMHASQAAIRNHQIEKIQALRNAVLNAILPNAPEEDIQLIFLNFIDSFTPWHLTILKFYQNPQEWGKINGIKYSDWTMGPPSAVLEETFPKLKGRRDFYDQIVKDLYSRGLMNIETLHVSMSPKGMFEKRTTEMGDQFIKFITFS